MSRQNSSHLEPPDQNKNNTPGADIQQELNRLEEIVLSSPHIPLTRRTVVDEELLLDQLDLVRHNLPIAFQQAQVIIEQKEEILLQAERQADEIIQAAQARAAQILSETEIMRQAELAAEQLRQQVEQEFITAQEQNQTEIDRMRLQAQQELEQMRKKAIAEAEEIQHGADEYADTVLRNLEQQLHDILRIIRNGRQQLNSATPPNTKSSSAQPEV